MRRVLVLEANQALRQSLLLALHSRAIEAEGLSDVAETGPAFAAGRVDAIVLGPTGGALRDLLATLSAASAASSSAAAAPSGEVIDPPPEILALIDGDSAAGLRAMGQGAGEFVSMAAEMDELALALKKISARRDFLDKRRRIPDVSPRAPLHRRSPEVQRPVLVGASPQIAAVLSLVHRLAGVRVGVLVGGESGTGKELVAQALHDLSPWRGGPFIAVNCGAIPGGLIESELFGHVRGSFTDAIRDRQGLFQAAHGGTLFLDEIADLPLALQPKLLRVLQDGVIRRVGDSEDVSVEVRVVAATARDLPAEVAAGRFREDLYYRLAGMTIALPALRERSEDVPGLAHHFLERARRRLGVKVSGIDPDALEHLMGYSWPGNVRELENTVERAAVLCGGDRIDVASLPERMIRADRALEPNRLSAVAVPVVGGGGGEIAPVASDLDRASLSIKRAARRSEEDLIRRALARTGGNRTRAAALLEISHRALLYKIKEYGIVIATGRGESGPEAAPSSPAFGTSRTSRRSS